MNRRGFIAASFATGLLSSGAAIAQNGTDETAVKQKIIDWYRAFANPRVDRAHYLSFMTEDYLLLENGELLDKAGDLALLDAFPTDMVRTDRFDFRRVTIDGDRAELVYFLEADITDAKEGSRTRRWLESALMKRVGGQWRCNLLHSTRISTTARKAS